MRHLLAATDLSAPADLALERAIGLARHTGARLTIALIDTPLEIPNLVTGNPSTGTSPMTLGELDRSISAYVDEQLAERVRRAEVAGLSASAVRRGGRPSDALSDLAEELDVDLIVLGSEGHTGVKRLVLGSVAEHVAHRAPRPVLIARGAGGGAFGKVLVATDFAPPATQALVVARKIATPDAEVEALYAWHYPAGGWGLAALGEQSHAMTALREALTRGPEERGAALVAAETLAGRALRWSLRHGAAAEVVTEEATAGGFDLVAIGTYGSGGVRRLLLGSVASQIMRHAPCSVLVTHA